MQGPFNHNSHRRPMAEINVVPFIDVMLVLLVIFMITAPMLTQGVQVELPQVSSAPIETQDNSEPVIVAVDKDGKYHITLGDSSTQVSLNELDQRIMTILARSPDSPVLVRGDRNVTYGQVVTLMSTLQGAGVENVGLISEPPKNE